MRETNPNHYLFRSDQRSNTNCLRQIHAPRYLRSRIVVMNLRFVLDICICKRTLQFWLEDLQELCWESNHFELLIVIQQMRNPLEIDFQKQEIFRQNIFDCTFVNAQNTSNLFCQIYGLSANNVQIASTYSFERGRLGLSSFSRPCSPSSKRCVHFQMTLSSIILDP
jgi:hypothetical protein